METVSRALSKERDITSRVTLLRPSWCGPGKNENGVISALHIKVQDNILKPTIM